MPEDRPQAQLQMVWPERLLASPPHVLVPPGYAMRQFAPSDADVYLALMAKAGFKSWDHEQIEKVLPSVLPGGWFLVEHAATGRLVATAMARHRPQVSHLQLAHSGHVRIEDATPHPDGGELSWVAADPEHKGKRLGMAVCAAVVARFLDAGYRRIYLLTDDHRLAAIRVYLALGFEPFLARDDPSTSLRAGMAERWQEILKQLGWRR